MSSTPQTVPVSSEKTSIQWGQLLMVLIVPLITASSWLNFGPLLPIIRQDFAVDNVALGLLTSATVFTQIALQLPGGYITDRLGDKWGITLGMLVVSLGVIGTALAPNFIILIACRALLGIGLAPAFISGLKMVREFAPRDKGAMVQGLYGGFGSCGMLLALLTAERLASYFTWRGSFIMEGVLILLVVCLVAVKLRPPAAPAKTTKMKVEPSWRSTFQQRPLYLLGIALALSYGLFTTLGAWVAVFLISQHGANPELAGPLAAIMALVAVITRLTSGPLVVGRERFVLVSTSFATTVLIALLALAPSIPLALIVMLLIGWTCNVAFGVIFSYSSLLSAANASGRDLSIINIVGNIGVFIFPLMVGWGLDTTGSFPFSFILLAICALVGSATIAVWLPHLPTALVPKKAQQA